jgi:hypothetical protein
MAIRLTEARLRQIISEEAARLVSETAPKEMTGMAGYMTGGSRPDYVEPPRRRGMVTSMEDAVDAVRSGRPADQDAACKFLARMFKGSPTPSMDISMALEDMGIDPDTAFDIGDACEMKYM